jgi:hypothetical protein
LGCLFAYAPIQGSALLRDVSSFLSCVLRFNIFFAIEMADYANRALDWLDSAHLNNLALAPALTLKPT